MSQENFHTFYLSLHQFNDNFVEQILKTAGWTPKDMFTNDYYINKMISKFETNFPNTNVFCFNMPYYDQDISDPVLEYLSFSEDKFPYNYYAMNKENPSNKVVKIPFSLHNLNYNVQQSILELTGWYMPNARQFYELMHPRYNLEYIYFPVNPDSDIKGSFVDMAIKHNSENCNKNMDEFITQVLNEQQQNSKDYCEAPAYQNNYGSESESVEADNEDNQSECSDESYDPSDDMPSLVSDSEDYGIVHPCPSESKSQNTMKWKDFRYRFYKNSILVCHQNKNKNKEFDNILDLKDFLDAKNKKTDVRTTGFYNEKLNSWIFSKSTEPLLKKLGIQK